jgi:GR25 family glycosyltransferase involved in LPS biosynthesis
MTHIHIYTVYSNNLDIRMKYINSTIDFVKKTTEKLGYVCSINVITEPSKEFVDTNIETFNKRVKYDKYPDDSKLNRDYNGLIQPLNSCQISNIEKHREIYKNILSKNEDDICLIMEDDVVVGQEYTHNIEQFFKKLKEKELGEWDMIFTCLPPINGEGKMRLISTREVFNHLMCKSSYIIRPSVCKKLIEFTETFKFTLKNGLSRFIHENPTLNMMYFNRHLFLEGSKIGILPSSINPNNFLFQNNQFISLTNISNKNDITDDDIKEAEKLYESIKHMDSADIMHIIGIIYYKKNDYANSKKFLIDAVASLKRNKGYLQQNSEILNNCINMHQYDQIYLEECKALPSKYS